ncbi:serine hydrolase [Siccirubricoccus sp. G192]|uniref:serine hydrolase domain-containing protein n=1 Tax=Siccirubricoccus sp. G192 TaxID=2849651 RepID=UPI001C2BE0EA|nr:serine hydrolase domain-containing protein [Siccirubricoccus sp. G192]MBV1798070.1 beta-lactamase family protein [Siccirubricoccus sp. G192]
MLRRAVLAMPGLLALALALPLAAQPLPGAKPEEVGLDPQRLARIRPFIEREVAESRLPGAVIMIARRGRLAYAEAIGFRDKAEGAPMPLDAVFRIYSMTKPMTSVAALMLAEEGRLQLTDPVSRHLPGFDRLQVSVAQPNATLARMGYALVPQARQMTLQDLLRHTSGLTYGTRTQNQPVREAYANLGLNEYMKHSPEEFTRRVTQAPLVHQPGTTFEYGLSTDVLGRVVEVVSGQRLEAFLEERLFRPLRMTDSGFWSPPEQIGRLARHLGVDPAQGNRPISMFDPAWPPGNASGGGGGLATAADYLRFAQMLANGGVLDGVRILSPESVRLMTADHLAGMAQPTPVGVLGTPGYGFGLGFAVRLQDGIAGVHGNAGQYMWAGYGGTHFWVDPRAELVAVYMTAAPSVDRAAYRRLIQQLVHSAIVE